MEHGREVSLRGSFQPGPHQSRAKVLLFFAPSPPLSAWLMYPAGWGVSQAWRSTADTLPLYLKKKKTVNKRMAPAVSVFHLRVRCCNAARQSFSGGTGHRGRGRNRSKRQACVSRLTAGDKNRINTPQHTLHLHHWFRNYWPRDIVLTGAHLL